MLSVSFTPGAFFSLNVYFNKNKAYLVEDIKINFEFFNTEKDLIIAFFRKILELNT